MAFGFWLLAFSSLQHYEASSIFVSCLITFRGLATCIFLLSSIDKSSIYASTPFKFVVEGNAYYIHADLVSQHSRPLDRMINGSMAEAQKGFAVLEDVDEGTFARFIEWAYKGYYTAAEFHLDTSNFPWLAKPSKEECEPTAFVPTPIEPAPEPTEYVPTPIEPAPEPTQYASEPAEYVPESPNTESSRGAEVAEPTADFSFTPFDFGKWGSLKPMTRQELKKYFIKRKHTVRREVISIAPTRANLRENENYTEVFLSHARLYVFAEKYDIQLLAMLALENLHDTLALYTLYHERTRDIVDLLRYVYANTSEQPEGHKNMRKLLKDYVGYEMKILIESKEFKELVIDDGGPLLDDFVEMVIKRID